MVRYRDVLLKTIFYKERIMKELVRKGIPPTNPNIEDKLKNIDLFLSLYKYEDAESGDKFNIDNFNLQMQCIQKDLEFLYELLYELTVKEYNDLVSYTESNLRELESISEQYSLRSELETNSSSLGNTIYFQTSGYNAIEKDNQVLIEIGKIKTRIGSSIAWILNANNIEPQDCIMGIKINEEIKYIGPHNYIGDTFTTPGVLNKKEYKFKIPESQIVNSNYKFDIDKLEPKEENKYLIYGGLNRCKYYSNDEYLLIDRDNNNSFYTESEGTFECYLRKGKEYKISYSEKPLIESINNNKILLKMNEYSGFTLEYDGEIYAEKNNGVILNGKLYSSSNLLSKEFIVEEIEQGAEIELECFLVFGGDNDLSNIKSIAIKELI